MRPSLFTEKLNQLKKFLSLRLLQITSTGRDRSYRLWQVKKHRCLSTGLKVRSREQSISFACLQRCLKKEVGYAQLKTVQILQGSRSPSLICARCSSLLA